MTLIDQNESAQSAYGDGAREMVVGADGGESPDRRFGRRALWRGLLLLLGTAVGVRAGVALLRRRRRSEREFTRIELDADPGER